MISPSSPSFLTRNDVTEYHAQCVVNAPGHRWLLSSQTGIGKSGQAITAFKQLGYKHILIVCPAVVRLHWVKQLDQFWPDHSAIGLIHAGKANTSLSKKKVAQLADAYHAPIQIVSYQLLKHVDIDGWEGIIWDEAHRIKTPDAKVSKVAQTMVRANTSAAIVAVTATPVANAPLDICGVVEQICPGRMGGIGPYGLQKKCKARYAQTIPCEYALSGVKYTGCNPYNVEELRARVAAMSSRTTRAEVAHLLPAFDVVHKPITGKADSFQSAVEVKLGAAMEWLEDNQDNDHLCLLAFRRDTARKVKERLLEADCGYEVFTITGAIPPGKRNEMLDQAAKAGRSIVVATMDSIGIGIDLTFCPVALVLELSYKPEVVIQALGRFSRFSSTVPGNVTILSVIGTPDEKIADIICEKIANINATVQPGQTELELEKALGGCADFAELAKQAAGAWVDFEIGDDDE